MKLSPKAIAATVVPLIAAALLWAVTGDKTFLVGCLLALAGGGAAIAAPPAPGVRQDEVEHLAERARGKP